MKSARAWDFIAVRGRKLDVVAHQLDCLFGNPSHGVAVANNFSEWEQGDDRHLVLGEVVLQLLGRHDDGVEKFPCLRVP